MKGREMQADSHILPVSYFPEFAILMHTHTQTCPLLYILPTHVQDAFGKHVNNPPLTKLPVSYRM